MADPRAQHALSHLQVSDLVPNWKLFLKPFSISKNKFGKLLTLYCCLRICSKNKLILKYILVIDYIMCGAVIENLVNFFRIFFFFFFDE